MAVSVATYNEGLLVRDSPRQGIQLRKIGSEDNRARHGLKSRIRALVGYWEELKDCSTPRRPFVGIGNEPELQILPNTCDGDQRDLFKPYGTVSSIAVPPPTYEESIQDLPPDYTTTDGLATAQLAKDAIAVENVVYFDQKKHFQTVSDSDELEVKVDFSKIDGIRSYRA